ncbi:glycosyl hydrolase family 8 [Streptomyces pathocidini]|uniref:Glucanase n=1 Tax=Streptomyces pathocidini TaxID=1650571 RepID=A0ABW7UUT4_9ACTN
MNWKAGPRRLTMTSIAIAVAAMAGSTTAIAVDGGAAEGSSKSTNLLTNPGFETGTLSGWSCTGNLGSVVSSPVHSGSKALKGAVTSSDNAKCTQTVSVQPNTEYTLSGRVQGRHVYIGATGSGQTWADTPGSYQKLTVKFKTGASQTSAQVFLHGWYAQGAYHADDIELIGPGGGQPPVTDPTPGPGEDTEAPTAPGNLRSTGKTHDSVALAWNASQDNVGVTGYDVYRGTTLAAANVTGTTASVNGLTAGTKYTFTVKAKDAAGNVSGQSNTLEVTTEADKDSAKIPFGSHKYSYAKDTTTVSGDRAANDKKVVEYYNDWKAKYLKDNVCGNSNWAAVRSDDASHPYVAEAQGYGLSVLATMAGADPEAKTLFDKVLTYVDDHPSKIDAGLHAAEQDAQCKSVNGSDSATDGDLEIAYALLLADKQWGSTGTHYYKGLALKRIQSIKKSEMVAATKLTNLGDWVTTSSNKDKWENTSRSSDWLIGHFRAFKQATNDTYWDGVVTEHQKAIKKLQDQHAPNTGMLPDFVFDTKTGNPKPAPAGTLESEHDGTYNWNACRDPWRIGVDALTSGDSQSRDAVRKMNAGIKKITGSNANNIKPGYYLDGRPIEDRNYQSAAFVAPFAVAAAASNDQAWLDSLWNKMNSMKSNYYNDSVNLQAMIAVTGNHWAPTQAS